MERTPYNRRFWTIDVVVGRMPSGGAWLEIGRRARRSEGPPRAFRLRLEEVDKLATGALPERVAKHVDLLERELTQQSPFGGFAVPRIGLDVDVALAGLPWTRLLAFDRSSDPAWDDPTRRVVTEVATPPQVADLSLSMPLRALLIDRSGGLGLEHLLAERSWYGTAITVETTSPDSISEWAEATAWPTVDVLHVAASLPRERSLSTAPGSPPLTLGWLARFCAVRQTRLVVFEPASDRDAVEARRLATVLAARGGPGSMIVPPTPTARRGRDRVVEEIYLGLLHDLPVDVVLADDLNTELLAPPVIAPIEVVGGRGREDLLRLSNMVDDITSIDWSEVIPPEPAPSPTLTVKPTSGSTVGDWWSAPRRARPRTIPGTAYPTLSSDDALPAGTVAFDTTDVGGRRLGHAVREVLLESDSWYFMRGESHGAQPAAEAFDRIREQLGLPPVVDADQDPRPLRPKYVNPLLAEPSGDAGSVEVELEGTSLVVGELYFLFLDVGPPSEITKRLALTPLQEIDLTSLEGTWIEIGVTGLDFDVEGPLTRELRVPYGNIDSETVAFPIRPMRPGTSRLRYSIYINQNLVRSYVLAARTRGEGVRRGSAREFAAALGDPSRIVGRRTWDVRLEYRTTQQFSASQPSRALSIITNHDARGSTITVKGVDTFKVVTSQFLSDVTGDIRSALAEISRPPNPRVRDKRHLRYGFGVDNAGSDAKLGEHLLRLAELGWKLYSQTIGDPDGVRAALESDGGVIHVAAMLRDDVVPWAAVYDRPYDPRWGKDDDPPLEHRVCLEALPGPDGTPAAVACGEHPCILAGRPLTDERTVACPLHFWGFRHIIELPPQLTAAGSADESDDDTEELAMSVENSVPVKVVAAAHGGLDGHESHFKTLRGELGARTDLSDPIYDRDAAVLALEQRDVDIVYFYCHAESTKPGGSDPVLRLRRPDQAMDRLIKAEDLNAGPRWTNRPLVFLNACETGAFRPDSISPFIDTLITNRGGGALIASEIEVFERLAREVSERLFTSFAGEKAVGVGPALLAIRQRLLAKRNVLGLVYSLYGASELHLANGR